MPSLLPPNQIRLRDGPLKQRETLNGQYLLQLDPDRLVHNFRINAGLPSSAVPLGGWENPACGLRGHFTGHYLSACSRTWAGTGDERFVARLNQVLHALRDCQLALGGGYLSAFLQTEFDILETKFTGVWAPYYTLHKILAGLLDAYHHASQDLALAMAIDLGHWIVRRISNLSASVLESMLRTDQINPSNEYGGIGIALYDLYTQTRQEEFLKAAQVFDRDWFLAPLSESRDELTGLHANTHIPQAITAARRYEITGDEAIRRAAEYFWHRTALCRSYVTGGSSGPRPDHCERSEGGEHWPHACQLAGTLTPRINESCVTHNMLRLTDQLACWSDDPRYADFRERVWLNAVPGTQHPARPGAYIYSHPLSGGSRKVYGDFDNTFWCCYGTGIEAFARLTDGAFYQDGDILLVNQFLSCEVRWPKHNVTIVQDTTFPYEQRTRLIVRIRTPSQFGISMRVPKWASGAICQVNGQSVPTQSGNRVLIHRRWADGDIVTLTLPMILHSEPLAGDATLNAFLYGPVVLAARTPHATVLNVPASAAVQMIKHVDPFRLAFELKLVSGTVVPLAAFSEIVDEAYGVYFKTP